MKKNDYYVDEIRAEEYKLELLDVSQDNKLAFLDHAFAFTSFSRSTAYNNGLDKLDSIKDALRKNRVKAKTDRKSVV